MTGEPFPLDQLSTVTARAHRGEVLLVRCRVVELVGGPHDGSTSFVPETWEPGAVMTFGPAVYVLRHDRDQAFHVEPGRLA